MAPLPDDNTLRGYIDYTSGQQLHTLQFRLGSGSTSTDAISVYNRLRGPMAALLYTSDSVLGLRWSPAGSELSFPLTVTPLAGTVVTTEDVDRRPNFISLVGRDIAGRRVRVTMYTPIVSPDDQGYRYANPTGGIDAWRDAVVAPLPDLVTINGLVPVWHSYVNSGTNAYYQRKARRITG